jgi:TPR repeat protein
MNDGGLTQEMEDGAGSQRVANAVFEVGAVPLVDTESGTPIDLREAATNLKLSQDQGDAVGQFQYGVCLESGLGVPTNYSEAARSYKPSAVKGMHLVSMVMDFVL